MPPILMRWHAHTKIPLRIKRARLIFLRSIPGQGGASTDHAEQSGLGGFLAKILGFAKGSQDHQDSAGSAQEADPDPAAFPELQTDMQEPSPEPTEQEREFTRAQQKAATSKPRRYFTILRLKLLRARFWHSWGLPAAENRQFST